MNFALGKRGFQRLIGPEAHPTQAPEEEDPALPEYEARR
jgi:hypothetical protein